MSFADADIPKLDIVGPPGVKHLLASMRMYVYRDKMPVIPTEAPFYFAPSTSPEPVFQDLNLTVYSVPVYPSTPVSEDSGSSSLKRKREASFDAPFKKIVNESGEIVSKLPSDKTLAQILESPEFSPSDFSPTDLRGEHAQEWREMMIDTMFPASKKEKEKRAKEKAAGIKPKVFEDNRKKEKGKQKAADEVDTRNPDDYRRARLPPGFHQKLPQYIYPDGDSIPHRAVAYVAVGPRIRGKFNAAKAAELKIPEGKVRVRLTRGETITFKVKENGAEIERTVQPEEVMGPSEVPGVVIIADVPTPDHIPSLAETFSKSPFFSKFRSTRPEDLQEYVVRVIYHVCGDGVLEDERYLEFMQGFGPQVNHVVASREHCANPVTFTSSAFHQLRLSKLDSDMFVVPKLSLTPKKDIAAISNLPQNVTLMEANTISNMRLATAPVKQSFALDLDRFHPAYINGLELEPAMQECFEKAKAEVAAFIESNQRPEVAGSDVRIITLGTGSAVPSKYRNVSGTAILIPGYGNILLDCGEGTWGQLARHFGEDESSPDNVRQFLRDLRCLFVSHVHGDHHMGVAHLLAQRKKLDPPPSQPLYLVTIRAIHLCLRELSDVQNLGLFDPVENGVISVMSPALHWRESNAYPTSGMWQIGGIEPWLDINESKMHGQDMCRALGLKSFRTVDMRHRTRCYGAVIKSNDGWSIVFSADTMPSDSLVYAGQGATVLIHEATMADDQEEMAQKKAHSTLGQALTIGRRMNAKNILLTHFSARYPKIPHYQVKSTDGQTTRGGETVIGSDAGDCPVAVAFDHARMRVDSLWKMNFYLSALEQSYLNTVTEDAEEGGEENGEAKMEVNVV
ncbi:hypothetical protein VKT23_018623 [Stygiomarasmius scandens]|uniref:ribonuclease Z n=1 Tax=Marasmiellus scandens TaxID=2682957 RepID=A0ABR1INV2_9AGAR